MQVLQSKYFEIHLISIEVNFIIIYALNFKQVFLCFLRLGLLFFIFIINCKAYYLRNSIS
jgi:hypothetical protein